MSVIKCPHCDEYIEILEINCKIFRHAYYLDYRPVNSHATKEELDELIKNNNLFGCGRPFYYDGKEPPRVCGYI
jgi:hypothetical protein